MNVQPGDQLDRNLVGANKGDVWTGFEWVTPQRYNELRAGPMPDLPPMQPLPGEPVVATAAEAKAAAHGVLVAQHAPRVPRPTPDFARVAKELTIVQLLKDIGENPERGGLLDTPARVVKAWEHWTSGYGMDAAAILKVFEDGAEETEEMIVVRGIPVYSHCEHHLAPIFGHATVAYIPGAEKRIIGLSKMSRLVNMYARRLQVQERLTNQVATALMEHIKPLGCGVVVTARHMCMESRGVQHQSDTTTSALRGAFKDDPTVRDEFLTLAR